MARTAAVRSMRRRLAGAAAPMVRHSAAGRFERRLGAAHAKGALHCIASQPPVDWLAGENKHLRHAHTHLWLTKLTVLRQHGEGLRLGVFSQLTALRHLLHAGLKGERARLRANPCILCKLQHDGGDLESRCAAHAVSCGGGGGGGRGRRERHSMHIIRMDPRTPFNIPDVLHQRHTRDPPAAPAGPPCNRCSVAACTCVRWCVRECMPA